MIWLTWRQFRVQAFTAAAAVAAFAILLAATGPHLASLYATSKIVGCHGFGCGTAVNNFLNQLAGPYPVVYLLGIGLILLTPAIIGIFWGAPLIAREFETRTFNLAWTQGITRTKWLAVKLTLTGLAAMAVTEALSLIYTWWANPITKAIGLGGPGDYPKVFSQGQFSSVIFASHGIAPLGYAAFAFTLATAVGALTRRALPAMAVTLAIFAAAQLAMPLWVRPHLTPPSHTTAAIATADLGYGTLTADVVPGQPGAWILSSQALSPAGQAVTTIPAGCRSVAYPGQKGGASAITPAQCMQRRGYREAIAYLPTSRYWPLQWVETGIFLALALALAWFSFWRLGRRRT
jgi:ABC-2 family transporter protein